MPLQPCLLGDVIEKSRLLGSFLSLSRPIGKANMSGVAEKLT